jgi:hydroxymethylbilane synthase
MKLTIGTRGSSLALAQAEGVRAQVAVLFPGAEVSLETVKTLGDRLGAAEAVETTGEVPPGLFTRELDEALLGGKIRAAVHSLKDVPTVLATGLQYGAILKREDPRDALISRSGLKFLELPAEARIGTSSPRREAQLKAARADIHVVPLRGNVDTRLRKLREGSVDAIVVAAAGLKRLGREGEITELLDPEVVLPAPAQGILCITIRQDDDELLESLKALDDPAARVCAEAERAFLRTLQGGCRVPVGALAIPDGERLNLKGLIAHTNGMRVMKDSRSGSIDKPQDLGRELAEVFLRDGAGEILKGFGRLKPGGI